MVIPERKRLMRKTLVLMSVLVVGLIVGFIVGQTTGGGCIQ
jgi:hypothetical protein